MLTFTAILADKPHKAGSFAFHKPFLVGYACRAPVSNQQGLCPVNQVRALFALKLHLHLMFETINAGSSCLGFLCVVCPGVEALRKQIPGSPMPMNSLLRREGAKDRHAGSGSD